MGEGRGGEGRFFCGGCFCKFLHTVAVTLRGQNYATFCASERITLSKWDQIPGIMAPVRQLPDH